jgi:DNA-binding NtrC family response regulator
VLVVDDQDGVRQAIVDQLALIGIEARTARDGREALQLCQAACDFDAVLADVVMPEIGGVELAGRLKQLRPDLPVILMTGHESQVDGAIDAGSVTLVKPFSLLSLERIIEEALADRPERERPA